MQGDEHAKKAKLHNLICMFQNTKRKEDDIGRGCLSGISKIVVRIRTCSWSKIQDEIM